MTHICQNMDVSTQRLDSSVFRQICVNYFQSEGVQYELLVSVNGGARVVVLSRNSITHMKKRRIQKNMTHKHQIYLKLTLLFKDIR